MRSAYLAAAAGLLVVAIFAAGASELGRRRPVELRPSLTKQAEYCLTCHADLPEISAAHPVETFGCVICHGGERLALEEDLAHSSMRGGANPSDFSVVEQSCGGSDCHSGSAAAQRDHIQRAMTSVQSTYAGAIASILYTYGAQSDLTARLGITAVTDDEVRTSTGVRSLAAFEPSAFSNEFVQGFGANCTSCHINAKPSDGEEFGRYTGCAACHTPTAASSDDPEAEIHVLTTAIPYTQCNTCHNRGNYDLRSMEFVARTDRPSGRLQDYYQPIAQFVKCEYTLDCIDCHTRVEAMGDGDLHSNKKEIQYVQCRTCHGTLTALPATMVLSDENDIAFRQAQLNPVASLNLGDRILVTEQGEPLWNTRVLADGTYQLIGKASAESLAFRPVMGSACTQDPEEQASQYCHECHAVER